MDATKLKVYLPFHSSTTKDLCGNSWTAYGSPTIENCTLKTNGVDQYLECAEMPPVNELFNSDFTIHFYMTYRDSKTSEGGFFTFYSHSFSWQCYSSKARFNANCTINGSNKWLAIDSANLSEFKDAEHHFAITRKDDTLYFFLDGTLKKSYTVGTFTDTDTTLHIARRSNNRTALNMRDFCIHTEALWTENFTPPTAAEYEELAFQLDSHVSFTVDVERRISNCVEFTADVERILRAKWRYVNLGDADDLIVSSTIKRNLPTTQSRTGSAFYQTTREKCFDLPATDEIWIKFDVYFDGSNRWRAYNGGSNGTTGITAQTTPALSCFVNGAGTNTAGTVVKNQLQTFLLHMHSHSSAGIVEAWLDGNLIHSYTGDVNHGEDFTDIYLQSDGAGTFFSNVIISNGEIGLNDGYQKFSADTERRVKNRTEFAVDVRRTTIEPIYIPLIGEHFNHYIASLKLFRGVPQKVILPKESKVYIRSGDGESIRIFSDTDNIGKILEGDKYFGLEECETVFIQMGSSPRQIIKNFINFIVDNSSLLDDHIDWSSTMAGADMMNAAINYITSGEFSTIKSLTDKFLADLNNSPTYTSFLRNYCDIILDNADTGAITGFDAGGAIAKTATSVVPETSSPENWTVPANGEVRIINGLTVHFPSYGETFYASLPVSRKYILAGLNSEWIAQSLNLIYETLGLDFNSPSAYIKDIYISFFNNIYGTLADISYLRSGDDILRIELQINMYYYEDVDTTSRDGRLVASSPHYESAGYLDRTIAHELTHAVMAANIPHFLRLTEYIIEGAAEIVHGIDDLRGGAIIDLLTTRRSDLEYVLTYGTSRQLSDEEYEAEGNYTAEDTYAAGYLFLRYLAKQFINNSDTIIITGLTICDSATGDSTREELSLDTLRTVLKPLKTFFDVEILGVIPVDFNADINRAILAKIFLFPIFRGDS